MVFDEFGLSMLIILHSFLLSTKCTHNDFSFQFEKI